MKLQRIAVGLFFCFMITSSYAVQLHETSVGYAVQLPDGWQVERSSVTQHIFYDTTNTYFSEVSIVRHDFGSSTTAITSPDEWTRANFIAYAFSIDADPLSVLAFSDTVSVFQNGTIRAADAYSYFYDPDTSVGDWAEYIRFAAIGTRGYEIYALGPMNDMDSNVTIYAQIIASITLLDSADINIPVITPFRHAVIRPSGATSAVPVHDLLGRTVHATTTRKLPAGLFLRPGRTTLRMNR